MPKKKDFMYQFEKVIKQLFIEDLWEENHSKKSSKKHKKNKHSTKSKKYQSSPTYFTPDSSYPSPPPSYSLPEPSNHSYPHYHTQQNIQMNISHPPFVPNYDTDSDPDDEDCDCAYHRSLRDKQKKKLESEINQAFHS
jgi:hypothetical protein